MLEIAAKAARPLHTKVHIAQKAEEQTALWGCSTYALHKRSKDREGQVLGRNHSRD